MIHFLTRKTAVDQAYMPLFQLRVGELKGGAFHTGSIFHYFQPILLTSLESIGIGSVNSPAIVELEVHLSKLIIREKPETYQR